MIFDFMIALAGALILDGAGFWNLKNTHAQFAGKLLELNYKSTLIPRIFFLGVGSVLIAVGRHVQFNRDIITVSGFLLVVTSYLMLFIRVSIKSRN